MEINKRILITGGTGTIGQELTKQLLASREPEEIIIFSRSEISQVKMKHCFGNDHRIGYVIGDIRDRDAINEACHGVDYVFHCAAIKHVGICENQPHEAIKTNITGTANIINACNINGVERLVNMSTDKAVNPTSFYGHTKAIAEKLIIQANYRSGNTEFINIRSGNVFGSSGSVVPLLINQIGMNNKATITDGDMTRYFVSIQDIAEFLITVMDKGSAGETYIMEKRPSFRLCTLAQLLCAEYGNKDTAITEIGARAGEKLHEQLFTPYEKITIMSSNGIKTSKSHIGKKEDSSDTVISKFELKKIITDGNSSH